MSTPVSLLIINPNTTQSMTDGLKASLDPLTPPGATLTYWTAPEEYGAPPMITDIGTGVASADACIRALKEQRYIEKYDGFLVCCCTYAFNDFSGLPISGDAQGGREWKSELQNSCIRGALFEI